MFIKNVSGSNQTISTGIRTSSGQVEAGAIVQVSDTIGIELINNEIDKWRTANPYDIVLASGWPLSGTGDPTGVVQPTVIGQTYTDTDVADPAVDPMDVYIAKGLTTADWTLLA